ncbi:MAG: baseplate J/gp47 family protein [Vicinamibacterales bacterium]
MSYEPRLYEDIVRDQLTTLTGGTVRESIVVPAIGDLPKLRNRPVRRVSHLEGQVEGRDGRPMAYTFGAADFVLVSSANDGNLDAIRFRDGGRRPMAGSTLTVNYYPVQTPPVPLTDLNVGSVVRTMLESVARELAATYQHLQKVYDSAYIDTAQGPSLDRVVALVGVTRLAADHPVATLRFSRRPDSPGQITLPAGTAVTDAKGNRYLTASTITIEPNETSIDVVAVGERVTTKVAAAGELNRLELAVAGVSTVSNPEAARAIGAGESDDALRRRARGALHAAVRGTVDAMRFGLLSVPGVKAVDIVEMPNGIPGEVSVAVAYEQDTPDVRAEVQRRLDELRPAGVRIVRNDAVSLSVGVAVRLTLAGTGVPASQLASINEPIAAALKNYLGSLAPGATARKSKLQALALGDGRVHDAQIVLKPAGSAEAEELVLQPGQAISVTGVEFTAPQAESSPAITAKVSVIVPVHLVGATTEADATDALKKSVAAYVAKGAPDLPLSVDGLVGAIRDDSRFAVVRSEVVLTVEKGDRFFQLVDRSGSYTPTASEGLVVGDVGVQVREGGV